MNTIGAEDFLMDFIMFIKTIFKIFKSILISGTIALFLNFFTLFVSRNIFNASLALLTPDDITPRTISFMKMIPESYFMALIGTLLFIFINYFFLNAWKIFIILVIIITSLWTIGPINHGIDLATKVSLSFTHLFIAISILIAIKYVFIGKDRRGIKD